MELERCSGYKSLTVMKQLMFVFVGGGFGSVLRYITVKFFESYNSIIPYGTLVSNILGSLCIGIILGMAVENKALNQHQILLLATGFCGGFTTFSSFAYENHTFLKNGDLTLFALYTIASLIISFVAVFLGVYLTRILV